MPYLKAHTVGLNYQHDEIGIRLTTTALKHCSKQLLMLKSPPVSPSTLMTALSWATWAPCVAGHMFFRHNSEGQLLFALWLHWVWKSSGPTLVGSLSVLLVNIHACWTSGASPLNWANSWTVPQKAWVRKLVFWLFLCVLNVVKLYFFIFETNTPYVLSLSYLIQMYCFLFLCWRLEL